MGAGGGGALISGEAYNRNLTVSEVHSYGLLTVCVI